MLISDFCPQNSALFRRLTPPWQRLGSLLQIPTVSLGLFTNFLEVLGQFKDKKNSNRNSFSGVGKIGQRRNCAKNCTILRNATGKFPVKNHSIPFIFSTNKAHVQTRNYANREISSGPYCKDMAISGLGRMGSARFRRFCDRWPLFKFRTIGGGVGFLSII